MRDQLANTKCLATVSTTTMAAFIASGFVAAFINLSQFLIIGSTSVLTFAVVGIVKTIITIIIAWWTEGKMIGLTDVLGVLLALGGSFAYSQLKG